MTEAQKLSVMVRNVSLHEPKNFRKLLNGGIGKKY